MVKYWKSALLAAVSFVALAPCVAVAQDVPQPAWPKVSLVTYDTGLRYWYSWGNTAKDLYDTTGSMMLSRLTYDQLRAHSAEAFLRADHSNGLFIKGYFGAGAINGGNLQDEDFAPVTVPYSSTNSSQKGGGQYYGNIDLGYRIVRGGDFNIGAFVGYHYLRQTVHAYGCTQTASNPDICVPAIPDVYRGISQTNNWHSARIGLDAQIDITDKVKLSLEAAWLPYVAMYGADTHWWRLGSDFTGAIPEDGKGRGYQLEGLLSYQVNPVLSLGVGARYWFMDTNSGHTHFENHVVGGGGRPQEVRWATETYGLFLQGSVKLGPYKNDLF